MTISPNNNAKISAPATSVPPFNLNNPDMDDNGKGLYLRRQIDTKAFRYLPHMTPLICADIRTHIAFFAASLISLSNAE